MVGRSPFGAIQSYLTIALTSVDRRGPNPGEERERVWLEAIVVVAPPGGRPLFAWSFEPVMRRSRTCAARCSCYDFWATLALGRISGARNQQHFVAFHTTMVGCYGNVEYIPQAQHHMPRVFVAGQEFWRRGRRRHGDQRCERIKNDYSVRNYCKCNKGFTAAPKEYVMFNDRGADVLA